jgi:hypothetical protein
MAAEKNTGATTMKKYYCRQRALHMWTVNVKQKNLTWTTNHGTEYGFCWLESMRNAYPTISITVPTTTVLKYHVRWRKSKTRWAASPMANRTTPSTPTAREGVYLAAMSASCSSNTGDVKTNPYMMIEALDSVIGLGKLGSI